MSSISLQVILPPLRTKSYHIGAILLPITSDPSLGVIDPRFHQSRNPRHSRLRNPRRLRLQNLDIHDPRTLDPYDCKPSIFMILKPSTFATAKPSIPTIAITLVPFPPLSVTALSTMHTIQHSTSHCNTTTVQHSTAQATLCTQHSAKYRHGSPRNRCGSLHDSAQFASCRLHGRHSSAPPANFSTLHLQQHYRCLRQLHAH